MSTPNARHSDDKSLKSRDEFPVGKPTLSQPNYYARLRAYYQHIAAEGLLQKSLGRKCAKAWAHAQQDFEDALFELLPRSGLGTVILDPTDTRTEHVRVTNAIICLHDWLRLYEEIIRQPPPKGLLVIERALSNRRDELNHFYPPKAYHSD